MNFTNVTANSANLPIEVRCSTAQEFIGRLRLTDTYWEDYKYGEVGFRGQRDATWDLLPSAFRPNVITKFLGDVVESEAQGSVITQQCLNELVAISQFLILADGLGLPVPGDNQLTRSREVYLSKYPEEIRNNWPPVEVLETLAIAQHHGVPTRLMDFTYHPLVAAFFAIANADATAENIAVWAVNMRYIQKRSGFQGAPLGDISFISAPSRIRVVTVPRAANSYLHAQHGFFLMDARANEQGSEVPLDMAFDSDVQNWLNLQNDSWCDIFGQIPPITKLLLPQPEARSALKLLYKEGITHAHIYPSYDSVVKTLKIRNELFQ